MSQIITPIDHRVPIVDPQTGLPTPEFIKKMNELLAKLNALLP